jgi:hypothetical protein
MERKVREAEQNLAEAGDLVLDADQRLRFLERAMVLRHEPPRIKDSRLRLHLSIYCETASRDDLTPSQAKKVTRLIEQCQLKLQAGCEHKVVVCHDSFVYGSNRLETGGHRVCADCGLGDAWNNGFELLDSAEGRTFVYYCGQDEEPDDLGDLD